ncbi:uncharacterized protein LOC117111723 [Anneissia japonica]|uniref:uncharacterized protein LOC117111723 n=1 Tax=Anneissia japonica TaxID=1529436 RepID=UPI0014255971|nr:uncharacterized protein LOC117111723 [Anneissia japonica]
MNKPRRPPTVPRNVKPHPVEKGPPPDPSLISKFKRSDPAKLKFDENEVGPNPTDLEMIVTGNTLPQLVQLLEDFDIDGNRVSLKAGDILMLHMIVEKDVVHAIDDNGLHFYLPIQAEQVYERLTLDPRVDDRLYIGVEALLKADILPPMVRVIENYYSADPTECVDEEDVLELYRVDVAPDDMRHRGRMCVYGKNQQNYDLYLHQGMSTAHFTTKISAHLHPMTELVELSFPQNGKKSVKEAAEINETEIKRQITDLKNEVDMWKNLYNAVKTITPERPDRPDKPPPERPPKPGQKPTTPTPDKEPVSSPKLPNKTDYVKSIGKLTSKKLLNKVTSFSHKTSKEPKMLKTPEIPAKPAKSPTSPKPPDPDTSYEQPMETTKNHYELQDDDDDDDDDDDEYDYIPGSEGDSGSNKQQSWKKKYESQQQMIETFRKQEASLKKELREAKNKNDEYVHKIHTLQREIESIMNNGEDIYDTINERPLPPTPNIMQHIYNSPSEGASRGMKISTKELQSYTVAGVERFMKEIGLEKYALAFRKEEIDGPLLLALDESMLTELGMSTLDARKLFVRIGKVTTGQ